MRPVSSGVMHPAPSGVQSFPFGVRHPVSPGVPSSSSGVMQPISSGITHPMFSGVFQPIYSKMMHLMSPRVMHPMPPRAVHPVPSRVAHKMSPGAAYQMPPGVTYRTSSEAMYQLSPGAMYQLSPGVMHPVLPRVIHPLLSYPHLFSNGMVSAPTTPVAIEAVRGVNNQHQTASGGQLCLLDGKSEQNNCSFKYNSKSELLPSSSTMDVSLVKKPEEIPSSTSARVSLANYMTEVSCFASSAPAAFNISRPRLSSKDKSSVNSVSQNRSFSLDVTPKRKTEKKLSRQNRRQQQSDNVGFAGAKFSESPQAEVLPLPPFIWCEAPSSSSCSVDGQPIPPMAEFVELKLIRREKPAWKKCIRGMRVKPLQHVAALPSS